MALPWRINWILTALTNYNVPVALVATPQFTTAQVTVEKNTHWASGQFIGRISRYVKLPESLAEEDLAAIARFHLPNGDAKSIKALVLYAMPRRSASVVSSMVLKQRGTPDASRQLSQI